MQSGQGADEVFAGYHWYPPMAAPDADSATYAAAFMDRDHARMAGVVSPEHLVAEPVSRAFVDAHFARPGAATPTDRALRLDTEVMLVEDPVKRVDSMTMAFGLEARVPFLDHELVELAAQCPPELKTGHGGKGVLKQAARRVIPSEVIDRPKGYFPVPGITHLRGPSLDLVTDALRAPEAKARGLYRQEEGRPVDRGRARGSRGADTAARQHPVAARSARAVAPGAGSVSGGGATVTMADNVVLECGWGRLVFGQTFSDVQTILDVLESEAPDRRDICMYARYPQVLVGLAPQDLFLDPSVTFRLDLSGGPDEQPYSCRVRTLSDSADAVEVNRIYSQNGMVTADVETLVDNGAGDVFVYLLALDEAGGVIGTVTGVDHRAAFGDEEAGTSLWCLAVDPQAGLPGVGRTLVRALADTFRERGRAWMDLSVLHDNTAAIALYEQLGFVREPVLVVKRKNPINEPLFTSPVQAEGLNPYAKIIADEARRRGISVRVLDGAWGEMEFSYAGRRVAMRESLSERTTAVAMSRCDDKRVSRRVFAEAGLHVPAAVESQGDEADRRFLSRHGEVVVKPARGEQGAGITVGVTDPGHLREAVEVARVHCPDVLIEQLCEGQDLRIVAIDHEVVAAAVRRPASVVGTGRHTVAQLIEKQSRRRASATGGESRIPVDDHTRDTVAKAGHSLDSVLAEGEVLQVRRTANLHTGGTIHDVTARLHPRLAEIAVAASHAIGIPVVGLDMLVPDVEAAEYVIIEANERPGLANHEPQPTAERFVDLLFPQTRRAWKESPR